MFKEALQKLHSTMISFTERSADLSRRKLKGRNLMLSIFIRVLFHFANSISAYVMYAYTTCVRYFWSYPSRQAGSTNAFLQCCSALSGVLTAISRKSPTILSRVHGHLKHRRRDKNILKNLYLTSKSDRTFAQSAIETMICDEYMYSSCTHDQQFRRRYVMSTYKRENTMKPNATPNNRCERLKIWLYVWPPVIETHKDRSKFPHNLPIVPACVLIIPALNSPVAIDSSITCIYSKLS